MAGERRALLADPCTVHV